MLKLDYYGQNDGTTVPGKASDGTPLTLTGDPGTDQLTLTNAGFLGGRIMAVVGNYSVDGSALIAPCDGASMLPYGVLINGPGEFAGAIGPSGSKKAPVVRALFKGAVDTTAYKTDDTYVAGARLYAGTGANVGKFVANAPAGATGWAAVPVATCTAVPNAANSFMLGVASLL